METLTTPLSRLVDVTRRLAEANAIAGQLRKERDGLETDLTAVYRSNPDLPNKIELRTSQMVLTVKRPTQWKRGWTLSKKELARLLNEILPEHGEDVMKDIERRHSSSLVSDDFGFELRSKTSDSS